MAKARTELTWTEIDPAGLPPDVAKAYAEYKASYAKMKEARQAFEQGLNAAVSPPAGKRVVCGYNFGKLSVALAEDVAKAPTQTKGSLADFLAANAGRRV